MGIVPPEPQAGIVPGSNLEWARGEWKEEVGRERKRELGVGLGDERLGWRGCAGRRGEEGKE